MAKLNLLNRIIQEPDNLDLELLSLCRNQKLTEESFHTLFSRIEDDYEVCPVSYFYEGMKKQLWRDILETEHFISFSAFACEVFFSSVDTYKPLKLSTKSFLNQFSTEELVKIATKLIEEDDGFEGTEIAVKEIYKALKPAEQEQLFKINVECSPKLYFKFEDYLGNWNEILNEGMPLFFEYFNNALVYNEVSFQSTFKTLLSHASLFDFKLKFDSMNFCEFITQKLIIHFNSEVIACISKDFFNLIGNLLELEEFNQTQILKYLKDNLASLDPKVFPFILKRWNLEKYSYPDSVKLEILQQILIGFYELKIVKYFVKDFQELSLRHPHTHILDLLEIFPLDFEIYDPGLLIKQFKKLNLSLCSKNLTLSLLDCVDLSSHDALYVYKEGLDSLFTLLKLEPFNYLYIDYVYLKAILKASKNKDSGEFQKVLTLVKEGDKYKENFTKDLPGLLAKNRGFKTLLKRSNLLESSILKIIKESSSEKFLAKEIMGTNSAFAQKFILTQVINEPKFNYPKLFWTYFLIKEGFNYDRVVNWVSSEPLTRVVFNLPHSFLRKLKLLFSEEKVFKLIRSAQKKKNLEILIKDTYKSLDFIISNNLLELAKNKTKECKNFIEFHDKVSEVFKFVTQPDFKLEQDLIKPLNGQKIKDYEIFIPERNHDLIDIGKTLHICVGDGQYGTQIKRKKIFILALKNKDNKFSHCLEIDRSSLKIKQSKTYHNKEMSPGLLSALNEKLFLFR